MLSSHLLCLAEFCQYLTCWAVFYETFFSYGYPIGFYSYIRGRAQKPDIESFVNQTVISISTTLQYDWRPQVVAARIVRKLVTKCTHGQRYKYFYDERIQQIQHVVGYWMDFQQAVCRYCVTLRSITACRVHLRDSASGSLSLQRLANIFHDTLAIYMYLTYSFRVPSPTCTERTN